MELSPMIYKGFIWPHNPRTFTVTYENVLNSKKVPYGKYVLQNTGETHRVFRGEGEFVGSGAYEQFRELARVFSDGEPGVLVHPVWQTGQAYFVKLELKQEPRKDYVSYSFEFWECCSENTALKYTATVFAPGSAAAGDSGKSGAAYYTVVSGDCLWNIARAYSTTVARLLELNPGISNPNLIYPGDKVRIK